MYFDDLTSRMAKLVKWLQPQIVSLSVLFWTEQPFELQPPDPSVGRKQTRVVFLHVCLCSLKFLTHSWTTYHLMQSPRKHTLPQNLPVI